MISAIDRMLRRFLPQPAEPTNGTPTVEELARRVMEEPPYPVLCGIVREGKNWRLIIGDDGSKGIRVVIVQSDVVQRFDAIQEATASMNDYLESLPYSYRKRRSRKRPTLENIAARDSGGPIG